MIKTPKFLFNLYQIVKMDLKQTVANFVKPFDTIEQYLKAITIIQKLFNRTQSNYKEVFESTKVLVKPITEMEIIAFIQVIIKYPVHPYVFLANQKPFINEIYAFAMDNCSTTKTIESYAQNCIYCGIKEQNWFEYKQPKFSKNAILFEVDNLGRNFNWLIKLYKILKKDIIYLEYLKIDVKQCKTCLNYHYISYAIDNKTKKRTFFREAIKQPYFQFTNETVYSEKIIKSLLADIMFKHSSFRAYSDAYNFYHAKYTKNRYFMNPKQLSDVFYSYEILKFNHEHNITNLLTSNFLNYN
jgi:hypothetical protein